jgi:3-hydroxybutyryl-CoA dehydrogenase
MNIDKIKHVTVLGTGNMGPGIGLQFARAGYRVCLWGPDDTFRAEGVANFNQNLEDMVRECFMDEMDALTVQKHTSITADLAEACDEAQFIVEAIPEVLELKQDMFSRLEDHCSHDAIIASNTSTLLPTPLSEKLNHKERLLVAHFWNPAHLAPLVEVCGSPATSPEVIEITMDILRKIGNEPVLMQKEIPGFIGNRIMHALNREALALIGAGVCDAEDIDKVVNASFGPRFAHLGPMEYLDFSGLDLIRNIQCYLYGDLDNTAGVMPVIEQLVTEGKLGMKTGTGLFDWSVKENCIREKRDKEFVRRLKAKCKNKV